jgi:hypothetical protein
MRDASAGGRQNEELKRIYAARKSCHHRCQAASEGPLADGTGRVTCSSRRSVRRRKGGRSRCSGGGGGMKGRVEPESRGDKAQGSCEGQKLGTYDKAGGDYSKGLDREQEQATGLKRR